MSIPRDVKVGPFRFTVEVDEAAIAKASKKEHLDLIGHTDEQALRIIVAPELAHDMAAETLLHEVLHALFMATGLDQRLGDDAGESAIRSLSPALLDVLRQNPELVAYLTT